MRWCLLLTGLSGLLARPACAADLAEPVVPLIGFEEPGVMDRLRRNSVDLTLVDAPAGGKALRVRYHRTDWPNVSFPAGDTPYDWSAHRGLAVEVTNPGDEEVTFAIRVDNEGADGTKNCNQVTFQAAPGATVTAALNFEIRLNLGYELWGMRGVPGGSANTTRVIDPTKVISFQIFLPRPEQSHTLILDNIRLFGRGTPFEPPTPWFVDRYGQYAYDTWPGKLTDPAQWPEWLAAERADLAAHPGLPDRDEYGGWASGPQLEATGWFRTAEVDGRWWLVTPTGRLFWSMGMDCVRRSNHTFIEQRDQWFEWVPTDEPAFGPFFGHVGRVHSGPVKSGRIFDFYGANLLRKYGENYADEWTTMTAQRLKSWGFNTIANWSDRATWPAMGVPFVATYGVGGDHARVPSGADYWGQMHDVYDPKFEVNAQRALAGGREAWVDNPLCLGVFVDNELSWGRADNYGLAIGTLNSPPEQPAKQAFLADLRGQYQTIARLNAAWGSQYASWDALAAKDAAPDPKSLTDAGRADLDGFIYRFSLRYFTIVRDAVRAASPHHLYLGCRFAWGNATSYRASAEVCDVVSFNIYQETVDPQRWAFTAELGKPVIIGEFHFGALDRGMFHTGLRGAANQAERAAKFARYVRSVAALPAFVGCHWFQYLDQPITGRTLDGENYNIGFITIVDQPHPEMVTAAREVFADLCAKRAAGAIPPGGGN